jgi:hypothetical protein
MDPEVVCDRGTRMEGTRCTKNDFNSQFGPAPESTPWRCDLPDRSSVCQRCIKDHEVWSGRGECAAHSRSTSWGHRNHRHRRRSLGHHHHRRMGTLGRCGQHHRRSGISKVPVRLRPEEMAMLSQAVDCQYHDSRSMTCCRRNHHHQSYHHRNRLGRRIQQHHPRGKLGPGVSGDSSLHFYTAVCLAEYQSYVT